MKIGIVGPSKPQWKNPEQYEKMKSKIEYIILMSGTLIKKEIVPDKVDLSDIIIVSGYCPVGEELLYDIEHNIFLPKYPNLNLGYEPHEDCKTIKVFNQGGVDTEAEIIAARLRVKTEIYPAICTFSESIGHSVESCKIHYETYPDYKGYKDHFWLYHFKPRNIQIAEACDILYCIVPETIYIDKYETPFFAEFSSYDRRYYCIHCKQFGHPTNGGCWTLNCTKWKLIKETHLVVIK